MAEVDRVTAESKVITDIEIIKMDETSYNRLSEYEEVEWIVADV